MPHYLLYLTVMTCLAYAVKFPVVIATVVVVALFKNEPRCGSQSVLGCQYEFAQEI